jgi:hypothetical protein
VVSLSPLAYNMFYKYPPPHLTFILLLMCTMDFGLTKSCGLQHALGFRLWGVGSGL